MQHELTLADAATQDWEAVVIGGGLAGATLAYGLAQRGQKVLVLEAGLAPAHLRMSDCYPEMALAFPNALASKLSPAELRRHGRQATPIADQSGHRRRSFVPFIGQGAGGSSRLYGMAMERFLPQDFDPSPDSARSATRRHPWPLDYSELAPWYDAAEQLYGVRGGRDPLTGPDRAMLPAAQPMDPGHQWLFDALAQRGASPYRLPLACKEAPDCRSCQGHLCQQDCKVSSLEACLQPALKTGHVQVAFECVAVRLEADASSVKVVVCQQRGTQHRLRARKFVLALGALYTPALLLRSPSEDWIHGLANGSGWVGRGLMRHGIDLYAVTFPDALLSDTDNRRKTLAFNDFYAGARGGLGTVQSFGRLPPMPMLASEVAADLQRLSPWLPGGVARLGARAASHVLRSLETRTLTLAATMEDSAEFTNQVLADPTAPDPASIQLRYVMTPHDRQRMAIFRQEMSKLLKGLKFRRIDQMLNNERIAHACGTCRAGRNPATSVVDADNRAHGLDNLWICDASYFPSSGGTNPSLTIAANALRIATRL